MKNERNCKNCSKSINDLHHIAKFCSVTCRKEYEFDQKYLKLEQNGIENIDYIKCKWCNQNAFKIKDHIRSRHTDKTIDDYKLEFPTALLLTEKHTKMLIENGKKILNSNKNPNHKSNTTIEQRKACSPFSIEFYKRKYPHLNLDEQQAMLNACVKKTTDGRIANTTIQYWLNKGFSQEESEKKLKDRQTTFTLEKLIKKHGEVEGTKIWQDRQNKWKDKVFNKDRHISKGTSKISESFFDNLIKELKLDESEILFKNNEKFIGDIELNRVFKYDFTIKSTKKMIEFNGDFWHCNPSKFKPDYYHKVKKMTAEQLWKFDKHKIDLAKSYGYDVLIIWEDEWLKNPQETINKCKQFLNATN